MSVKEYNGTPLPAAIQFSFLFKRVALTACPALS